MSREKQFKVKQKQRLKRKKRREKLKKQKLNPDEYFFGGRFVAK